jgi:hypothetical protein
MTFVTEIPRVTEPGRFRLFECTDCNQTGFQLDVGRP